jgi:hypothetical protein
MNANENLFKPLAEYDTADELHALISRSRVARPSPAAQTNAATTGRLHGFDLKDAPILAGLSMFPGELVPARTTVALRRSMIGATVLVLYEDGDAARPIIVGVVQEQAPLHIAASSAPVFEAKVDDDRLTLTAEREIVLRCGDSSITLTRAGKVIIKGNYILSRSRGYNKIKGAAIDIN